MALTWRDFEHELAALDGEARAERARQIIAANQATLSDDPPAWLLEAAGSRALNEDDLQTEDFAGVEVLSIGGPVFGVGSPAGGEHITKSRLAQIVADSRELREAGELRGPIKLGHSERQAFLRASGITDGELPAAGWVENVRLNEDGTRALADFKRVPKLLAKLVRAGAYRTRSAELKRVLSQANGKTYEMVIGGVVLQGEKAPAIRTLDDFVKLYEADDDESGELVAVAETERHLAEWSTAFINDLPDSSFLYVEPGGSKDSEGKTTPRSLRHFPVKDASGKVDLPHLRNALARIPQSNVPASVKTRITASARRMLEQAGGRALQERAATLRELGLLGEYETLRFDFASPADTSDVPELTFTEEATRSLAEMLGLEGDDVTPEKIAEATVALKEKADADPERKRELEESDLARAFEEYREAKDEETAGLKQQIETVQEERRLEQRAAFVESLVRDGKIPPAGKDARKKWEDRFDKDAEMARSFAEDLQPDPDLVREFGAEGDEEPDEEQRKLEDAADAARLGIPVEELI
ncbi:MAG: hypothetical protein ACRDY6_13720 [Acidimicrobiia bacterium]